MARRPANIIQADVARILRAYRSAGMMVRATLMPDGSTAFEPIEKTSEQEVELPRSKEIVL